MTQRTQLPYIFITCPECNLHYLRVCSGNTLAGTPELEIIERVCERASKAKKIEALDLDRLEAAFGPRFARAWEAVKSKRVKKYAFKPGNRVVWIVVGKGRDYLIIPTVDFCTCDDFFFRVMDRQIHLCYHLIAQKLAEALECYDLYEEERELYDALMREWRKTIA